MTVPIPRVLIIAGEPVPTRRALRDACAAARATGASVSIAQLVPVGNPVLLGDPSAFWSLTVEQQLLLDGYANVAEGCGVSVQVHAMQTIEHDVALVDLVEILEPQIAYVPALAQGPAWWRAWRRRRLCAAFGRRRCRIVWVDHSVPTGSPAANDRYAASVNG